MSAPELLIPLPPAAPDPVPLADLAPGASAVVEHVDPDGGLGRRLLDLGFAPGTALRVLRRAPLGDPVVYELRGYRVSLRRSEAVRVWVRPDDRAPGDP